ncbi:GumC family protein [Pontibacter chinhatensis]|uniref:non-specific protein-tyrosine kinase n=1 Tax=Pontibacter chinhatensis TaxID=1436961 RepID=A0A1I2X136_9BACT|nr:tyrosine-protein kinase [Pontibacter chinhatensis]SFH06396.1 capsular exopolysaccharide family [Pontibacter chinhatensis]
MRENELFPLKSEQPQAKNIREIINQYAKFWYLFLVGGVLGFGGAYLYCLYYTIPQYSITSTILLKGSENGPDVGALGDISINKSAKNINNEIEVLYSLSLMQRVVSELNLSVGYLVEGRVKSTEIYGRDVPISVLISRFDSTAYGKSVFIHLKSNNTYLLEEDSGKVTSNRFGQQVNRPYGAFTIVTAPNNAGQNWAGKKIQVVFQDLKKVAQHYNQVLYILPKRDDASVLEISLVDPLPEKGINIINKLIEVYNNEAIEDKNLQAANTIEFLDERLKYITTELSDVEKNVEDYKRQNELTDVSSLASQYLEQAAGYNNKLSEWAIQIDILESIEEYLGSNNNQYKMVPSTLTIQDPTLAGLIARFNELQLERERLLRNAFPNNPLVQNINEQLEDLRTNIIENLRNIKKGLIITSNNLKASSGQYKSKISKVPSMERELLEINREQAIKQNLYLYLLQKREEAAISLAASISNTRIVDPAIATDYPISPNKRNIYLMSILLGLAVPFAGIFVYNLLNTKIQTLKDVELLTGAPIIGELVHNTSGEALVVTAGNRSPIVEMFRLIRAKLHFAAVDKENKVILVTSGMSGEGKTFFSVNLGATMALTGKKVMLLELDLRSPNLCSYLGLPHGLGISDYLVSDSIILDDIVMASEENEGLFVIGAGSIPPNPAELMMSSKLGHMIDNLKESFDYIIIDTAPVGQVADAFCLSSLIDSTIYVIRYNYTYKEQIAILESIYRNKELSHPMVVLNDAKPDGRHKYGYGYGEYGSKRKKSILS